ncbi:DWNN domain containing protein [Nitzschia inconspicua]|uniref:DWNN domain containing protein n=1 Tax=Nitzschia inconspicua TaxID=303405 RepID=A0A9K3Q1C2_9STRA|nr:DWNN domain containing protein [Nitzschia inconspicua]
MSSTILYKFRASSTFEALPLPGSAARLFDVKKAIVKANKLDTGSMEFDLAVRNADTNEEYANESMLLPRGTRLIVQRLPAARGHGFLARMARNEHAGAAGVAGAGQQHPSGYYTIDSRARDDDEFVTGPVATESNEDKELAALQAVTTVQTSGPAMTGSALGGRRGPSQPAGMGPPVGHKPNFSKSMAAPRPNADPELREQEQQPKKRMTGIPRTFLSLSTPPQTDGGEGEQQTSMLQPNKIGFEELINRGGGLSENSARTKSLDYALSITSTTVPEHLQCAICHNVVKNAMLLPWDPEGRTVCESCIRDALTQNGFRCPLTGTDGVSPDDLIPNVGLRKAADLFVKGVMDKLQEIEDQQVEDTAATAEDNNAHTSETNILDGEGVEKGVIVSKRMSLSSHKKSGDDDPFGGGDLFGGDVFAVAKPQLTEEETEPSKAKPGETNSKPDESKNSNNEAKPSMDSKETEKSSGKDGSTAKPSDGVTDSKDTKGPEDADHSSSNGDPSSSTYQTNINDKANGGEAAATDSADKPRDSPASSAPSHRREYRRRGPPAGYTMGPAGGAIGSARASQNHSSLPPDGNVDSGGPGRGGGRGRYPSRGGGAGGRFHDNRGGGGYGRGVGGRGRFDGNRPYHNDDDDSSRGTKRSWDEQMDHIPPDGQGGRFRNDGRGGRGGRGGYQGGGRGGGRWGGPPRGGGGFRGRGRGRF